MLYYYIRIADSSLGSEDHRTENPLKRQVLILKRAELTIQDIIHVLLSHIIPILLCALLVGFGAWLYTNKRVPKLYRTFVTFYAQSKTDPEEITASGLTANRQLASTYSYIVKSNTVMKEASAKLKDEGVYYSFSQLRGMTTMATTNTEIFTLTVSSTDRKHIKLIADTIANAGVDRIRAIVTNGDVKILDVAETPAAPYSPNITTNTITGALVGLLLACVFFVIRALTDTTIWNEEDLSKQYDIPVLGSIPMLAVTEKQNAAKE